MLKLSNIQILRAIAALSVVFYHTGLEASAVCTGTGTPCHYNLTWGFDGVMLFFMISGFIMVTTSWNDFAVQGSPLKFMYRRLTRIVPLYWVATTLAVIAVWSLPGMLNEPVPFSADYILKSYLFWPAARVSGIVWPIANLGWTLNLEMFFYVIFSLGLMFRRPVGLALAIGALFTLSMVRTSGLFAVDGLWPSVPLHFWGDPAVLNFILGMLAGVAYMRGLRANLMVCLALIAATCVLATGLAEIQTYVDGLQKTGFANRMFYSLPMVPLFLAGAFGPQMNEAKLPWRALVLVGNASYGLYLYHSLALRGFRGLWVKIIGTHLPAWSFIAPALLLALAVGLCVYFLFERPMTQFFTKRRHKPLDVRRVALAN